MPFGQFQRPHDGGEYAWHGKMDNAKHSVADSFQLFRPCRRLVNTQLRHPDDRHRWRISSGACGELGYTFHPSFWGKGYATEPVPAFVARFWGFRSIIRTITAKTYIDL